ncbi:MAG: hypothetical protein LBU37_00230 [Tannerellaceae bacterium]|jgi:hypothetical protein|nr:hypothetical protein [Tannerellaceae bacterium]
MKHICKQGIILVILFLILTACSQKTSLSLEWIPFYWEGDTISGKYVEKAYLYIPVKIDNLPHDFTMQLDLGTYGTQFYGNAIRPYLDEYPSLADKSGSARGVDSIVFKHINLQMGTVGFNDVDVWRRRNFGDVIPKDSIHSATPKHIGTIAPDLFRDKVLTIDYKAGRLAVSDSLPAEYKDLPAEEFELADGIIKLPFRINGKACTLMFDTGSSPFQIVTTKERALEISNSIITDSLSGPLWWGNEITFYGLEINKPVAFGGKTLQNGKVFYDKEGLWEEVYNSFHVWGITGNACFFENTIIIDYKNKLFRVK